MKGGVPLQQARSVKAKLAAMLAGRPELRGIGVAMLEDGFGVKVNLSCRPADLVIPQTLDGVVVIIDVVEPVRPL